MRSRLAAVPTCYALAVGLALLAARPRDAGGQASPTPESAERPASGSLVGTVVDAETGAPLARARVVLSPVPTGVVPSADTPFIAADRAVMTDSLGFYRFLALAAGDYTLHVRRINYRPATLEVSLRASASSLVSVGMTVVPVRLQVIEVRATPDVARGGVAAPTPGSRAAVERLRQEQFLSADVRTFTASDAQESVTLAEFDLFRALQRLPGVDGRDGYSADLLTRGARSDGTRIYFDGLPLIDPLHAYGSLSGLATGAIGTAFLHPGVRPASLGEGGAAVADLQTRTAASDTLHGSVQLSQVSGNATAGRRASSGRWAWMMAGQGSSLGSDAVGLFWAHVLPPQTPAGRHTFFDVSGRGDLQLGTSTALEASALLARDRGTHDVGFSRLDSLPNYGFRKGSPSEWGNTAGRLTLVTRLGGLAARFTAGVSRYSSGVVPNAGDALVDTTGTSAELPMRMTIVHSMFSGSAEPARAAELPVGSPPPWTVGYEVMRRDARFAGRAEQLFAFNLITPDTVIAGTLTTVALWGEHRWSLGPRVEAQTGLRLETGGSIRDAGAVRPAPRVAVRYHLSQTTTVSAAIGRAYQYAQALTSPALGARGALYPSHLWMLSGGDVPALRTNLATLGVERWLGGDWLSSANVYSRSGDGLILADPRPGPLFGRPLFVVGDERAKGVELAARRLEGRWTASLSYSYAQAEQRALGLEFSSPYERRHTLEASGMFRVRPSLRLGAAYSQSSGTPFTRTHDHAATPTAEAPYAERLAANATGDLLLDWSRPFEAWQLGAFLQLHMTYSRSGSALYSGTSGCEYYAGVCRPADVGILPYPLYPVVGLRISF